MKLDHLDLDLAEVPGAFPAWRGQVTAQEWRAACVHIGAGGGRLVALWASDRPDEPHARFAVHAALVVQSGLVVMTLPLEAVRHFPT